jgi:hypothetical protein
MLDVLDVLEVLEVLETLEVLGMLEMLETPVALEVLVDRRDKVVDAATSVSL